MPTESRIEIISIDGRKSAKPWLCVEHCLKLMPAGFFSAARVFSPVCPDLSPANGTEISWEFFPSGDIHSYSRFCLENLAGVVEGTHVLIVQNDGYILRPDLWDPEWLQYDYIGAPWPLHVTQSKFARVGNGGFSLRSAKLLRECAKLEYVVGQPEDMQICVTHRCALLGHGIEYAPVKSARRFSVELVETKEPTFGFHKVTGSDGRVLLE